MSDDLFGDDNPLMRAATDVFSAAAAPSPLFAGTLGLVKADCARFTYYFERSTFILIVVFIKMYLKMKWGCETPFQ